MAFNIHFLAFILLAVSLKTRLQVVPSTSFHHFLFATFGCTFSAAVAYNHCRSPVNFLHLIIIIMVIFKCYFSGEHIALSINKNNNGVNIALGKTNRSKALCMMRINT